MKSCLNCSGSFFCLQQVSFKKFYRIRHSLAVQGVWRKVENEKRSSDKKQLCGNGIYMLNFFNGLYLISKKIHTFA